MHALMNIAKLASFAALILYAAIGSAETVNLNTADAQTIHSSLKGIGEKKAQAIVNYRDEHGPFENVEDIMNVKGIGDGIFKKIKDDLILNDRDTETSTLETDPNGLEKVSEEQRETGTENPAS